MDETDGVLVGKSRSGTVLKRAPKPRMVRTGGVNPGVAEPAVDGNVTGWTNVSNDPLFSSGGPSPLDIRQGSANDCFFLSALADVAYQDPQLIKNEIRARGDGTYDVYFHTTTGWVDEHVDGNLPVNSSGQLEYAKLGQDGATWVPIMEKAFAYFRNAARGPSYSSIDFGWPSAAPWDLGAGSVQNYVLLRRRFPSSRWPPAR